MKRLIPPTLALYLSLFFSGQVPADEFRSIFDGKSLAGWHAGDMSYWSVQDGAITAESTPEHPCTLNRFLIWQGGEPGDFELRLKFRLANNRGNSGIQFRSVLLPNGDTVGYQADIFQGGELAGRTLRREHTPRNAHGPQRP